MNRNLFASLCVIGLASDSGAAHAKGGEHEAGSVEAATPSNDAVDDGPRFRFGVSGSYGFFSAKAKGANDGVGMQYGGADLRFGTQINDMLGIYAQSVLGYYSTSEVGTLAVGGLLGAAVAADVTLMDRFFVGGGLGYHIYNNPGGPSLLLRGGGYPLMGRSKTKARRKGLMLGVDLRVTFLSGLAPIVQPTFNLGYEAF